MEPQAAGGESLVELIGQLAEPTQPPAVSMMPQTWGWAVIGAVLLAALIWMIWRAWRRYRANAYRREALRLIEGAADDPARLAEILRRTALAAYPRGDVASLTGQGWLEFLDRQVNGTAFAQGAGQVLTRAPYQPARPDAALTRLAAGWVRHHRSARP